MAEPAGTPAGPGREIAVVYFAAAADAAGTASEVVATSAVTLGQFVAEVRARHGAGLSEVLDASAFLLGDTLTRDPETPLAGLARIDVMPPFAGG